MRRRRLSSCLVSTLALTAPLFALTIAGCTAETSSDQPACTDAHPLVSNAGGPPGTIVDDTAFPKGSREPLYFATTGAIFEVDIEKKKSDILSIPGAVALALTPSNLVVLDELGVELVDRQSGKRTLVSLPELESATALATSHDAIFVGGPNGVFRLTLDASHADKLETTQSYGDVGGLVVDETTGSLYGYMFDGSVGTVVAFDEGASMGRRVSGAGPDAPSAGSQPIALDGDYVYWANNASEGKILRAPTAGGAPVIVGDYTGMVSGLQVIDGVVYTTGTHGLQRSDSQQGGVMVDLFNQQPAISPLAKTTHGLAFGVTNDRFLACGQ